MFKKNVIFTILPAIILNICCSRINESELMVHLHDMEHLTVYQFDKKTTGRIEFIKEQTFGDTEDVFFQFMYQVGIDKIGRVFISELAMGYRSIHVFDFDGNYLGNIGQQGDGPGEYQTPTHLQIRDEHLFIYDNLHQRISAFSLDSFSLSFAISLPFEKMKKIDELAGTHVQRLFVRNDGSFLVGFGSLIPNVDPRYEYYYVIDRDGELQPEKIFEERAISIFDFRTNNGSFEGMLPFSRKSLTVLSNDDYIFSTWTEEILIKVYNSDGNEVHVIYYPFSNTAMDSEDFADGLSRTSSFNHILPYIEFPETWPALESMLIDDENRLWLSTIVKDFDIYEWWVLENNGDLVAWFEWPRNKPIEVIKDGYIYTRETDEETGLQQVARYRIVMEEV